MGPPHRRIGACTMSRWKIWFSPTSATLGLLHCRVRHSQRVPNDLAELATASDGTGRRLAIGGWVRIWPYSPPPPHPQPSPPSPPPLPDNTPAAASCPRHLFWH